MNSSPKIKNQKSGFLVNSINGIFNKTYDALKRSNKVVFNVKIIKYAILLNY